MKHQLKDTSFLIPVRQDSLERVENLLSTTAFIQDNFDTNIIVCEMDRSNNHILEKLLRKVKYFFVKDDDIIFHRTRFLNMMVAATSTPVIAIWDTDAIAFPDAILESVEHIRSSKAKVAYPYDGRIFEATSFLREKFIETGKIEVLVKNLNLMSMLYGRVDMVGAAIFFDREAYVVGGGENEKYYGWGNEDYDRAERWRALKYPIYRYESPLFHLSHPRGNNSTFTSEFATQVNAYLIEQVRGVFYTDNLGKSSEKSTDM